MLSTMHGENHIKFTPKSLIGIQNIAVCHNIETQSEGTHNKCYYSVRLPPIRNARAVETLFTPLTA
jgi:hypothetical protein